MFSLYNDLIDAVLADNGLSIPVNMVYGGKWVACPDCHNGAFKPGGTLPYNHHYQCLTCDGVGKAQIKEIEQIYLCVSFDPGSFYTLNTQATNLDKIDAEIMGRLDILPKILGADYLQIDIEAGDCPDFEMFFRKSGSPEICGFDDKKYFVMPIKKINKIPRLISE